MSTVSEDQVREMVSVLSLSDEGIRNIWFRSATNAGDSPSILHMMDREVWESFGRPNEITIRTKPGDVIGDYFATSIGLDGQMIGDGEEQSG